MDYDALIYVINRVERRDVDVVGRKKFVSKTIVNDRHALFRDCYSVNDAQRFKKKEDFVSSQISIVINLIHLRVTRQKKFVGILLSLSLSCPISRLNSVWTVGLYRFSVLRVVTRKDSRELCL